MMSQSDLSLSLGYALKTTTFTLNKVSSKSVVKTPYEMRTAKSPSLSFLKIWSYEAFVKRLQSDKLAPKLDKCIFVQSEGKVFVARNGVFSRERVYQRREK